MGKVTGFLEIEREQPARREVTFVGGKLEWKVPLMADEEEEMGWTRYQHEVSVNKLKAQYPWVRDKIAAGGNVGGMDQIDRLARINVRLAVQASSSSGESYKNDSTESVTFYRPSEYEAIADEDVRNLFFETFPDGLEVWHAGGNMAFCRNARMSKHVKFAHPGPGDGQNREALLTNYLPLQKVLNANISLIDRYFRAAVPRRFALEPYIDTQLLNSQSNDPGKVTPVTGLEDKMLKIGDITGVESVPVPNTSIFEFVQWLIQGGPEAMDGGSPAAFGEADGEADQGVRFGDIDVAHDRERQFRALSVHGQPRQRLRDGKASADGCANRLELHAVVAHPLRLRGDELDGRFAPNDPSGARIVDHGIGAEEGQNGVDPAAHRRDRQRTHGRPSHGRALKGPGTPDHGRFVA